MSFSDLSLLPQILQNIKDIGYERPTPVQLQVIPLALNGRDILAAAQTGTGKTAAFSLPIINNLLKNKTDSIQTPKALVLVPTRELAMQVGKNIEMYSYKLPLKIAAIYGGANISPQTKLLARGVDIIVATPGRLLDHVKLKGVDLTKIEYLVFDEADSMLDMGFIREIEKILALLPSKRQTMLFSATLSGSVKRLSENILRKPQLVQIASYASVAKNIKQVAYTVDKEKKNEMLSYMIGSQNWKRVLVFCRTKAAAEEVATDMTSRGLVSESIHSDKTHGARGRALEGFKTGKIRVLVATDLAARGIDIEDLPFVINYDVPHIPTDYVHRIGRTGRAGSNGEAITLLSSSENHSFKKIEDLLGKNIERKILQGYEPTFVEEVKKDKVNKNLKNKDSQPKKKTAGAFGKGYKNNNTSTNNRVIKKDSSNKKSQNIKMIAKSNSTRGK